MERAKTVSDKTPMHQCKGMAGLMVPLIREGTRADHRAVERGDYVGKELVTCDANGRVIMAVQTVRDEGEDCTVYAPTARATMED